ncbi:hypothetical protein [Agrococcus carbonis]|uniref:hypothetical protein n=1 Tax=Agrococcus carbonis TaxID=684552 RepID=UPI000B8056DC|nr:hypothetical protein [Agrococcus carbonis]
MPILLTRPRAQATERTVRVLAVYDGDAERSRRVIARVLDEVGEALGRERFAAAVDVRALDLELEPSRSAQLAACREAELVIGLDADHLRGLARPLLARHRVFTLEELTLTLERVAHAPTAHAVVSILDRGHAAFSRSVVKAACAARGLTHVVRARRRAATVEEYAPRLARALSELAIGCALP